MKWNRWKMKLKNIDTQQHGFSDGLKSSNIFLKKNDLEFIELRDSV